VGGCAIHRYFIFIINKSKIIFAAYRGAWLFEYYIIIYFFDFFIISVIAVFYCADIKYIIVCPLVINKEFIICPAVVFIYAVFYIIKIIIRRGSGIEKFYDLL